MHTYIHKSVIKKKNFQRDNSMQTAYESGIGDVGPRVP